MNAYTFLSRDFASRAQSVCLKDGAQLYRYADIESESARRAALLAGLGLSPGERVAALVEKSPQALFLHLGALRAGLVFVPLDPDRPQAELADIVADVEPQVIVCRPDALAPLQGMARGARVFTLGGDGEGTLSEALPEAGTPFDALPREADDLAAILYTTGTTGRPRGAMLTHGNLAASAAALAGHWRITARDTLIHALPLHHVHGLMLAVHPLLLAGATIILQRKFEVRALLADFAHATLLMIRPACYAQLLAEPALTHQACSSMRLFMSGSAPLPIRTFDAFRERTGHAIRQHYEMTEAGVVAANPCQDEREANIKPGTVGRPIPGVQLRVYGPNLKPMPFDHTGDIQIKGANVFKGWWRMPEETAGAFTADGWFGTGDMGTWDEDGYVTLVGRDADRIRSAGFAVHPHEVEQALDALPGVAESAVIGVPHAELGQAVVAVIARGVDCALTEASVVAALKDKLVHFKMPRRVHFVDALPRSATGNVRKNRLRAQFANLRVPSA